MSELSSYTKVFTYDIKGVDFTVTLHGIEGVAGSFWTQTEITNGKPIFNSLLWADEIADGFQFKFAQPNKPFSLTGIQFEGQTVDWDGGILNGRWIYTPSEFWDKLPDTIDSFDDIDLLGVNGVNSKSGRAIKLVAEGELSKPMAPDYVFDREDAHIITLVWKDAALDTDGDGYTSYAFKNAGSAPSSDPDDLIAGMLAYLDREQGVVVSEDELLGVLVRYEGDLSASAYYGYGSNDTNGFMPDPRPDGFQYGQVLGDVSTSFLDISPDYFAYL